MRLPLYRRVLGYYRVSCDTRYQTRLQNLLFVAGIVAYSDEKGGFYIPRRAKSHFLLLAKRERLSVSVSEILGLPRVLMAQKHRVGVPIGILLGIFLLFVGTHTVWRVEISGNRSLSSEAIEEALAEAGFGVGSKTAWESYEGVIAACRILHPEIAWMGIYTEGTTAFVKVIESTEYPSGEVENQPSHLVADKDALILQTDILHGTCTVKAGNVVKAGDLLVLGLSAGANKDTFFAAEGSVIGRVSEVFSVKIPLVRTEKLETKRKTLSFSLNFFEKEINIFKSTGKKAQDYVIIKRNERLSLPGGLLLPFGYSVCEALFYETKEIEVARADAVREGMDRLEEKILASTKDGEILSKSIDVREENGALVLYATVEYTKNIAVRLPFAVS